MAESSREYSSASWMARRPIDAPGSAYRRAAVRPSPARGRWSGGEGNVRPQQGWCAPHARKWERVSVAVYKGEVPENARVMREEGFLRF